MKTFYKISGGIFQSHNIKVGMDLHIIQPLSLLTNKNIEVYRK